MHSMTHPQAMWPDPLWPVLLSLSLFPASLETEKEDAGAPGWETSPPCPAAVSRGGGAVWPLFHPTLSDSLQSAVPGSSFSLPSPPPRFRVSALSLSLPLSVSVTCRFPRLPLPVWAPLAAASWVGRALSSVPRAPWGLSQIPEQASHWHAATHTPSPGLSLAAISSAVPWLREE